MHICRACVQFQALFGSLLPDLGTGRTGTGPAHNAARGRGDAPFFPLPAAPLCLPLHLPCLSICSIHHIPYACHTHNTLAAQATPYPTSSPARAEMAMPAPRSAAVQIRAPPAEPVREFVPAAKAQGDANGILPDGKKRGACGSMSVRTRMMYR